MITGPKIPLVLSLGNGTSGADRRTYSLESCAENFGRPIGCELSQNLEELYRGILRFRSLPRHQAAIRYGASTRLRPFAAFKCAAADARGLTIIQLMFCQSMFGQCTEILENRSSHCIDSINCLQTVTVTALFSEYVCTKIPCLCDFGARNHYLRTGVALLGDFHPEAGHPGAIVKISWGWFLSCQIPFLLGYIL